MPADSFVAGDLFTIRVTKYLSTNPDNKWANSYEARAVVDGVEADLLGLGSAIVSFEAAFHRDVIVFDHLLISTWEPDSVPYDPAVFISSPLTAEGEKALSTEQLLGLSNCLDVRRFAATGRYGHLFFRGYLTEAQVEAPAGKTVLSDRGAVQTDIDDALSSSGLSDYVGPSAEKFQIVMISATGTQVRVVTSFSVGQVAQVKQDHRWFNRTTSP